MKKLSILLLFIANVALGQSTLIEPKYNNGILSKHLTTVITDPGTVALPVSGQGTRLMWIPAKSAFRVGTVVSADWDAENIGTWSFSTGYDTKASGTSSTSFGKHTRAIGYSSTSMGQANFATGAISTVMGVGTTAQAYASLVIGAYNIISGSQDGWSINDPVFVVGNGTDYNDRKNALTLLKNGNLGLGITNPNTTLAAIRYASNNSTADLAGTNHTTHFNYSSTEDTYIRGGKDGAKLLLNDSQGLGNVGVGLSNPQEKLDINGRIRVRHLNSNNTAGIWMSNASNGLAGTDGAFFGMNCSTAGSETAGIFIGGEWAMDINRSGNMRIRGTISSSQGILACSDKRFKKDFTKIENPLSKITQLEGLHYYWRTDDFADRGFTKDRQTGFIAQEIEKIFPEMVFTDEKGYKSVDYARLTPVLVEAIKELKAKNERLEANNLKLESRLDKIETLLSR